MAIRRFQVRMAMELADPEDEVGVHTVAGLLSEALHDSSMEGVKILELDIEEDTA